MDKSTYYTVERKDGLTVGNAYTLAGAKRIATQRGGVMILIYKRDANGIYHFHKKALPKDC